MFQRQRFVGVPCLLVAPTTVAAADDRYITSGLGQQVVRPEGELLGIIAFPEQPAKVTFGGADQKTRYVTACTSLYTVAMEATGHQFRGKKPK